MSNQFTIGQATDPGIKRKNRPNQDSISLVLPDESGNKAPLMVLADGMGGYNGGEIASSLAAAAVCDHYRRSDLAGRDLAALLPECIDEAQKALREKASEDAALRRMGSTIVLAALEKECVHIANVGDSRAYLITAEGRISRVSYDHSLVMEQVRRGIITEEEALRHPRRNVLTMSLSGTPEAVTPYLTRVRWQTGDHILICSDGLWGTVPESRIGNIIASEEPQEAADDLIRLANMNQGPDNISVMTARNGENLFTGSVSEITGFNQPVTGDPLPAVPASAGKKNRRKKILTAGIILILMLTAAIIAVLSRNSTAGTGTEPVSGSPAAAETAE